MQQRKARFGVESGLVRACAFCVVSQQSLQSPPAGIQLMITLRADSSWFGRSPTTAPGNNDSVRTFGSPHEQHSPVNTDITSHRTPSLSGSSGSFDRYGRFVVSRHRISSRFNSQPIWPQGASCQRRQIPSFVASDPIVAKSKISFYISDTSAVQGKHSSRNTGGPLEGCLRKPPKICRGGD